MSEKVLTNGLTLRRPDTVASPLQAVAGILWSKPRRDDGPQVQVALGPTHAWSIDVRRDPIRIEVLEGEVMVTFEGDLHDDAPRPRGRRGLPAEPVQRGRGVTARSGLWP